jgi:dTMP kinase
MTQGKGFFISIEGDDKAGKTTQAGLLAEWLRSRGFDVVETREPGGTAAGEAIRRILLHTEASILTPVSEALLFAASRGQLVDELIRPALEAGKVVVADRYVDSSLAYQACALGLPFEKVLAVNEWATASLWPDLTILLDLREPNLVAGRSHGGATDRIEGRRSAFHRKVAAAYRRLAARDPARFRVIDATQPAPVVAAAVLEAARGFIDREEVPRQ